VLIESIPFEVKTITVANNILLKILFQMMNETFKILLLFLSCKNDNAISKVENSQPDIHIDSDILNFKVPDTINSTGGLYANIRYDISLDSATVK